MDDIKSKLGKVGLFIGVMGMLSVMLCIFNYNIRLLSWVDAWGNTSGWIIRIVLIVIGAALFFIYGRAEDDL